MDEEQRGTATEKKEDIIETQASGITDKEDVIESEGKREESGINQILAKLTDMDERMNRFEGQLNSVKDNTSAFVEAGGVIREDADDMYETKRDIEPKYTAIEDLDLSL